MSAVAEHARIPEWLMSEPSRARTAARVRLAEIIGALSDALELTGQPPSHCLRACWIGMHTGQMLGLGADALSDLYYALLLKDVGCSSDAALAWKWHGAGQVRPSRARQSTDSQRLPEHLPLPLHHADPGATLRARLRRLVNPWRNGETLATELNRTRCTRGSDIVRRLGFGESVAECIASLDEHWNGGGHPRGLCGAAIPVPARIALLAEVVEVFHGTAGEHGACAEAHRRVGSWFDPQVCRAFFAVSRSEAFWMALREPRLEERVRALEPDARTIPIEEDRLESIAETFADLIDARSGFTCGHSRRVACYADAVAAELGLSAPQRRCLRRGALLHDIGKLAPSRASADGPSHLDADDWESVKRHAHVTEQMLLRARAFGPLGPAPGVHPGRADGSDSAKPPVGRAIALETRIITVADIFDAITTARPCRDAIPVERALEMMERERDTAVDGQCLDALRRSAPWSRSAAR